MVFVGINFIPVAIFLMQSHQSAFFSNQSLCIRKEALGTRLSGHALFSNSTRTKSFHIVEVGTAVARVQKKNIQAEVKYRKIRKNCQQKKVFHISKSRSDT